MCVMCWPYNTCERRTRTIRIRNPHNHRREPIGCRLVGRSVDRHQQYSRFHCLAFMLYAYYCYRCDDVLFLKKNVYIQVQVCIVINVIVVIKKRGRLVERLREPLKKTERAGNTLKTFYEEEEENQQPNETNRLIRSLSFSRILPYLCIRSCVCIIYYIRVYSYY